MFLILGWSWKGGVHFFVKIGVLGQSLGSGSGFFENERKLV
jgi:hypothetical protein